MLLELPCVWLLYHYAVLYCPNIFIYHYALQYCPTIMLSVVYYCPTIVLSAVYYCPTIMLSSIALHCMPFVVLSFLPSTMFHHVICFLVFIHLLYLNRLKC